MSSQFRSSARNLERTFNSTQSATDPSRPQRSRLAMRRIDELRASHSLPARVLIDATYTLGSSRRSGIERVVRNLLNHCQQLSSDGGTDCATLMSLQDQFFHIDPSQDARLKRVLDTQSDILGALPRGYRELTETVVNQFRSDKLRHWLLPQRGHMGMFKLPYRYWYKYQMRQMCRQAEKIQPGQGDLLILPDAYWARKEIWPAVAQARAQGAYAAVVVYDLIPLTHPQFVGQRRMRRFEEYLKQVATHADLILAISETVRHQLEETLPKLLPGQDYCRSIVDFPLGAEFPAELNSVAVRDDLKQLFEDPTQESPYLTVAAFDPRKNHRYLLDAFDLCWTRMLPAAKAGASLPKLCLVGRVGGRCDDIMQRIAHHPLLGRQLFTFHDLNDAELQYCYRQCRGVIFPSITEGFGLPIVESLWHGARTLASDTPIHREVGGNSCEYFDLARPSSLVQLLTRPAPASDRTQVRPYTWSESAEIFFSECLQGYRGQQVGHLARSA